MLKKLFIFIAIFSFIHNSIANPEKFIVNSRQAISEFDLRDVKDAWEIIRIDYPRSKAVFVYSSNGVDFCLFDLNKENKFVLFCSPSFPKIVKFSLDNVQKPEAIQKCFMKLPDDEAHNSDGLKFFGGIFELEAGKECELQIGMDICSGKFLATVRRKIDTERKKIMPEAANVWTWWEGNIVITPEPTPKQ